MKRRAALAGLLSLLLTPATAPAKNATTRSLAPFGSEVAFEANTGQHDGHVRFVARDRRDTLLVTPDRGVLLLPSVKDGGTRIALRFGLDGARADANCRGEQELRGRANYYLGNDPKRWRTNIARFARVVCSDVRPGIDIVYYGREGRIEWDVVVAPGADASNLFVRFDGADSIAVAKDGSLALSGAFGTLSQHAPHAFQRDGNEERAIEAKWTVVEAGARLELGAHDARLALVVDPVIEYSTTLGGTSGDVVKSIGIDGQGNVHVVGTTWSLDFPGIGGIPAGSSDVFWLVLAPDGSSILRATYFGGSADEFTGSPGSGAFAVAADGGIALGGSTTSADLPTRLAPQPLPGGDKDGFAARFGSDGALLWSTYLGGAANDLANGIALDPLGNAYVVGTTTSQNFPTAHPFQPLLDQDGGGNCFVTVEACQDAFLAKIPASGASFAFSTYLGGRGYDTGYDVAVDASGSAYVVGGSGGGLPLKNAFQSSLNNDFPFSLCSQFWSCPDAFLTRFAPSGQALLYSTYLGGEDGDVAYAIALHPAGAALVAGTTRSTLFPLGNAAQPLNAGGNGDGFVAFFNPSGSQLLYSTYLGGPKYDGVVDAAIDAQGVATVVGNGFSGIYAMDDEVHVAQFGPGGVLGTSFSFGGSAHDEGWAVALDAGANPWIGGATASADFPLVDPIQTAHINDGFLVELGPAPGDLACNVDFSQPSYGNGQIVQVTSLRFQNTTLLPKRVRLRLTLAPPGQSPFTAADLTTWFAPGFSTDLAPVDLFTVSPGVPRGQITMGCELLDAGDGTVRAADTGVVQIQ